MPSFEFGPITTDDGGPTDTDVRTVGRVQAIRSVVSLELMQRTGQEGETFWESAVRWTVGLQMPPSAARYIAALLIAEAEKAEELSCEIS